MQDTNILQQLREQATLRFMPDGTPYPTPRFDEVLFGKLIAKCCADICTEEAVRARQVRDTPRGHVASQLAFDIKSTFSVDLVRDGEVAIKRRKFPHADVLIAITNHVPVQYSRPHDRDWIDYVAEEGQPTPLTHPLLEWRILPDSDTRRWRWYHKAAMTEAEAKQTFGLEFTRMGKL